MSFYGPAGSQWLCSSVQLYPHLVLFYCTPATLLLCNGGGCKRREKFWFFFVPHRPKQNPEHVCVRKRPCSHSLSGPSSDGALSLTGEWAAAANTHWTHFRLKVWCQRDVGLSELWLHTWCVCVCLSGLGFRCMCVCVIKQLVAAVMHPHYVPILWPSYPGCWTSPVGLFTPPSNNPPPPVFQLPPSPNMQCWVFLLTTDWPPMED